MVVDELRPELTSSGSRRDPVVKRAVICIAVASIEGTSAASVVFLAALAYHLAILGVPLGAFSHVFYAAFAVLTGVVYGSFSAIACGRFLDSDKSRQSTVSDSVYGWTAAVAITLLTAFLVGGIGDLSRVSLTTAYVAGLPLLLMLRGYNQSLMAQRIEKGELHYEKVAVIGRRTDLVNFLINGNLWRRGHRLTGTLYLEDALDENGVLRDQAVTDFARNSLRLGADHVVFLSDLSDMDGLERVLDEIKRFSLNFVYAPATGNTSLKFLDIVAIGPNNAIRFMRKPMSDAAVLLKRATDLVLSSIGLIVLLPLFLVVAIAIVLDSPGPVVYRQARRGFNGETFMIWKFRSMTVTESGLDMQQARNGDARITRVGRFLRSTSIDELPQLVNVFLGQMSLVGPRPHAISHDEELSKRMANYAHRQRIKPGITGWAQVNGFRGETATQQQIEGRVIHDIYYIDNWSIFLDLWTLLLTFLSPAVRRNAR